MKCTKELADILRRAKEHVDKIPKSCRTNVDPCGRTRGGTKGKQ